MPFAHGQHQPVRQNRKTISYHTQPGNAIYTYFQLLLIVASVGNVSRVLAVGDSTKRRRINCARCYIRRRTAYSLSSGLFATRKRESGKKAKFRTIIPQKSLDNPYCLTAVPVCNTGTAHAFPLSSLEAKQARVSSFPRQVQYEVYSYSLVVLQVWRGATRLLYTSRV